MKIPSDAKLQASSMVSGTSFESTMPQLQLEAVEDTSPTELFVSESRLLILCSCSIISSAHPPLSLLSSAPVVEAVAALEAAFMKPVMALMTFLRSCNRPSNMLLLPSYKCMSNWNSRTEIVHLNTKQ